MSLEPGVDHLGVEKKFPSFDNGIELFQDDPNSGFEESYKKYGYATIPGVKIWRKTFSFNKIKLRPDQEVTIYVFLPKLNPEYGSHKDVGRCSSGSGLSIKLRGSRHPKQKDSPQSARCYIFHFEFEGGNCNNFQKEYPHPRYSKHDLPEENEFPNWIGNLMGFKVATLNTPDSKGVEFWAWFDPSAKIIDGHLVTENNWHLRYHGTDTGQYGENKNKRKTKEPFLESFGKLIEFRMDNADENTACYYASAKEVKRG